MAIDFLLTAQLADAVIGELEDHLPATWFVAGRAAGEEPLRLLEHGDLADYCGDDRALALQLPAIFVRPLSAALLDGHGGTGGVEVIDHRFRLVHVRHFDQCYDGDGAKEDNQTRARARYAKTISKALYADKHRRLDNPTLTTSDSAARILMVTTGGWDFGTDFTGGGTPDVAVVRRLSQQGTRIWAIACDFSIHVRVTPT